MLMCCLVLNKYFPPDFDPDLIPRRKGPRNSQQVVRLMAPFSMYVYLSMSACHIHMLMSIPGDVTHAANIFTKGRSSTQGKKRLTGKTTMESRYSGSTSNGKHT